MADPVLNEKQLLADLDRISSFANASQLKNGARLTIIDAFDRRVDREPFAGLVAEACSLQANLSRLELVCHIRTLLRDGKLDDNLLAETVKSLTEVCETHRTALHKQFHPVTEMRLSTDTVN